MDAIGWMDIRVPCGTTNSENAHKGMTFPDNAFYWACMENEILVYVCLETVWRHQSILRAAGRFEDFAITNYKRCAFDCPTLSVISTDC
jgi:hypothetical protein